MGQQFFASTSERTSSSLHHDGPSSTDRVVAASSPRVAVISSRRAGPPPSCRALGFPGGKVEQGESDADALKREVRHRLGSRSKWRSHLFVSHPTSTTSSICTSTIAASSLASARRQLNAFRWVRVRVRSLPFTPADEASMNKLLGLG